MPMRLTSFDPGFAKAFDTLLSQKREVSADVDRAVGEIIADVRSKGDAVDLIKQVERGELED